MEVLQYVLLVLVSYLGLLAGFIISWMAKEELLIGRKYFAILKAVAFGLIFMNFMYYLKINTIISVLMSTVAGVFCFVLGFSSLDLFFYSLFALFIYEMRNSDALPFTGILIFIYGLATSSLEMKPHKKILHSMIKIFGKRSVYLLISFVLLAIRL